MALVVAFWPQKELLADLLALLVEEPHELPIVWNLLVQSHIRKFHRRLGVALSSHMEGVMQLVHKGRIFEGIIANDLRRSTARLYQRK